MHDEIFPGQSEMARRMRELDWSKTPLGPPELWPQSLRTTVSTSLDCAFPIVMYWGPQLVVLYNDEYCPMLGPEKHPLALGRPGADVWAEIWDVIKPMLSQVVSRGEPTRSRDLLLHIDRRGYPEEAYFSFSFSPIRAEEGKVAGVFCPVIETTDKIIGERRLRTLRDLAARCKGAESERLACVAAANVLAANPHDVPFALVYRIDEDARSASLLATAGISPDAAAASSHVSLDANGDGLWSLAAVARSGRPALAVDLQRQFASLPSGAWKTPPHTAIVLPVLMPGSDHPRAVLVAAVSPMRALDDDYSTFFGLIASQIASGLADAEALEAERKRAEALAELDRAKTAFFSNVSHEFRTPLTLMISPLNDLASSAGLLPADAAAAVDVARRNSLRLLKLVNTLLDFSRIEAGRIDASYEASDLASLTADLASVFRSAIERAGLRLVVDCEPLQQPVYVDRDMWEKIVLNLLSNAFKHTFDGSITVCLERHHDRVTLSVSDTGTGIPASDVTRVFERFHRVKNARARTHEGTGIGLALVQELVRLHGGSVSVQSAEGHGTTFTVSVPTGTSHLPPDKIAAPRQLVSTSIGSNPYVEEALRWLPGSGTQPAEHDNVLDIPGSVAPPSATAAIDRVFVVDDNADMRDYLSRMLGAHYNVEAFSDGRAALDRIRQAPPDLVLTDVMMPALDGFGLLAAIRSDERTRALPVIVLSARAGEEARIEGLSAGADDYLVKPFSARELLARIASQLDLSRLRQKTERTLRYHSEERQTLIRQAPLGVYLVDADFTIREVNPVAMPVFGDIPGGVVGRDFDEVMHIIWAKEYADEIVGIFRRTLDTGEPYVTPERAEFRIDRQTIEYYEWRLDRITLPDGRYGLVCYFRDISTQVKARLAIADSERRLRDADRRKDEFLALLAHELRNPLAPIRTGLELIRVSGDRPETVRRVRTMMERQVGHMVRLIDDLLDVSRITSGKIVLRRAPTEIGELIQSAIDAQRVAIDQAGIEVTADLGGTHCVLDVDPTRFVQIVSNILHNAVKFTPAAGTIHVTAGVQSTAAGAEEFVLSVTDSGIGISDEMLPRVFDLFAQGEQTLERQKGGGGLGIGLALARRLIEMHDGHIEAHSDGPGRGSTFVIRLPVSTRAAAVRTTSRGPAHRISSRVLIVDDNEDAASSMAMLIRALGGRATTAHDALSALAKMKDFDPDVVFLDIGMPGIDGYEACRRIRSLPSERRVTIVALTGWGHPQDKQRALDVGFDAHLTKPVDPSAVEELLATLAGGSTSVSA
jgi:PAS domain S-box-containing protein